MGWYLAVLKKYAVFSGRARRMEYWMFVLFNVVIGTVLRLVDHGIGTYSAESQVGLLSSIYILAILIPALAVSVRRLHDTGRTGWWILVGLVPCIGGLILLVFYLLPGESGSNAYGPNPKGAAG